MLDPITLKEAIRRLTKEQKMLKDSGHDETPGSPEYCERVGLIHGLQIALDMIALVKK